MRKNLFYLTALAPIIDAVLASIAPQIAPQIQSVMMIGTATSNFPNIYSDGGGGGTINGRNLIMISDGTCTGGGIPTSDNSNLVNFTPYSIACSSCDDYGITSLQDFGTSSKGPYQQIPFFYDGGENETVTAIWPNSAIASLCNCSCGVSFPPVVNRTAFKAGENPALCVQHWRADQPGPVRLSRSFASCAEPVRG